MSLHHLLTTLPPAQHAILISENYKNSLGPFMIEACGGSKEDITLFEKKREEESEIVRRMSVNGTPQPAKVQTKALLAFPKILAKFQHDKDPVPPRELALLLSMTASHVRNMRFMATRMALKAVTHLCGVAKKLAGTARSKKGNEARKTAIEDIIMELVDGVFVHRYRDIDPHIRAECIKELCIWIKSYPASFLDDAYLRYIGWLLSDRSHIPRLEALKAYITLHALPNIKPSLLSFTLRFKPRLLEIALKDSELSLRPVGLSTIGPEILEDDEIQAVLQSIASGARCEKFVIEVLKETMEEGGIKAVLHQLEGVGATEAESANARSKIDQLVDNAWSSEILHDYKAMCEQVLADEAEIGLTVLACSCKRISTEEGKKTSMSQYLVGQIPQLMKKFCSRPDGVVDLIILMGSIDLGVYVQLGESAAYEAMLDELKKVFFKHVEMTSLAYITKFFAEAQKIDILPATIVKMTELKEETIAAFEEEQSEGNYARLECLAKVVNLELPLEHLKNIKGIDILYYHTLWSVKDARERNTNTVFTDVFTVYSGLLETYLEPSKWKHLHALATDLLGLFKISNIDAPNMEETAHAMLRTFQERVEADNEVDIRSLINLIKVGVYGVIQLDAELICLLNRYDDRIDGVLKEYIQNRMSKLSESVWSRAIVLSFSGLRSEIQLNTRLAELPTITLVKLMVANIKGSSRLDLTKIVDETLAWWKDEIPIKPSATIKHSWASFLFVLQTILSESQDTTVEYRQNLLGTIKESLTRQHWEADSIVTQFTSFLTKSKSQAPRKARKKASRDTDDETTEEEAEEETSKRPSRQAATNSRTEKQNDPPSDENSDEDEQHRNELSQMMEDIKELKRSQATKKPSPETSDDDLSQADLSVADLQLMTPNKRAGTNNDVGSGKKARLDTPMSNIDFASSPRLGGR